MNNVTINISSVFKLSNEEFTQQLNALTDHVKEKGLEHTLDGRLVGTDVPRAAWISEIALKPITDQPKEATLSIIKDLSIILYRSVGQNGNAVTTICLLCQEIIRGNSANCSSLQESLWMSVTAAVLGNGTLLNHLPFGKELTLADIRRAVDTGAYKGSTALGLVLHAARHARPEAGQWLFSRFGDELTFDDFRAPLGEKQKDKTGLMLVLDVVAALPEAWQLFQRRFGEQLTVEDFRKKDNEGCTGILRALHWEGYHMPEAWSFIQKQFEKELVLADFLTPAKLEEVRGKTGLWMVLKALWNNNPNSWYWFKKRFGAEVTVDHFKAVVNEGNQEQETGLYRAFAAFANQRPEAWQWIQTRFGEQLTLDDFRVQKWNKTGLWMALMAAVYGRGEMWRFIWERFGHQLVHADLCMKPNDANEITLEHLCCIGPSAFSTLCQILDNCGGMAFPLDRLLKNKAIPDSCKKVLGLYNHIADVVSRREHIKFNVQKELDALLAEAQNLDETESETVGFYYIARFFLESSGYIAESIQCYRQVKRGSILFEEARLKIAEILLSGLYDKDGNPLTAPVAKRRAWEEALQMVTEPVTKHAEKFITLKRRLVANLLGSDTPGDLSAYSWVDEETNFPILLNRITERKVDQQTALITALQARVLQLESQLQSKGAAV